MKMTFKKFYVGMLSGAVAVSTFAPMVNVRADGYTYTLNFQATGTHTMEMEGTHLKIDGQYVELRDKDNESVTIGTSSCTDNKNCKIEVTDGPKGKLNYYSDNKFSLYMQGHEVGDHEFEYGENIAVQDYVAPSDPVEPGPDGPQFDGKAYIIWSCGSGICYKYYDNVPGFADGNSYFIKDTTIEADNNPGQKFNVKAEYKYWASKEGFDNWVDAYKTYKGITGEIDWTKVNPEDMLSEPIDVRPYEKEAEESGACTKEGKVQEEFEACVNNYAASKGVWVARAQLQPVGEPNDNNAYVSYGDRNFKVVIYNDNYKGVTLGSLDGLNYYPASWTNPFIRQDQFDISGTTKAKPTYINTVLLESTVKIKELNYNGFQITKIEALDVPKEAVSISKVDGEWKLVFSSNFYDNVVFKATDSNGGVSYFAIKRYTVDAWINNVEGAPHLYAEMYFDKNKNYSDFNLTAKIIYNDGTISNVKLTPYNKIDDGLGNITTAYEVDESISPDPEHQPAGKGLKKAVYIYKLPNGKTDKDIDKAYVNVEYKGSTSTKYAGSFAGSGKGILANIYKPEEEA